MQLRNFGRTGLQTSLYGLGTWAMGGGVYGDSDDRESIRVIHRAQELGVNFIDTAPMYSIGDGRDGRAERVIGEALQGRRDRWLVATKFGRHLSGGADWDRDMIKDFSGARAIQSVEESLGRLRTDYLDVLFVHSPLAADFNPADAFEAMARLKQQGKIRVIGYSFLESIADTLPLVEPYLRSGVIEAVQVKFSLLYPETNQLLLPIIRETGVAVAAREALARGFLTASFAADDHFPASDWKAHLDRAYIAAQLDRAAQFNWLVDPARGVRNLPEAALAWVASHPEVSNILPGPRNVAELEGCLSAADAPAFPSDVMQRVESIRAAW